MSFKAYFLSDIHLKTEEERNTKILLHFFLSLEEEIKSDNSSKRPSDIHLFLVGDIFDFWISDHQYFAEKFSKVVKAIKSLANSGIKIHYFEGNHDLYLENFWGELNGISVHREPKYFSLGNYTLRVEHGDLIDPDDKGYLFLKSVLNSAPLKWFAKNCPGSIIAKIGEKSSEVSRSYTSNNKTISEEKSISKVITYGKKSFAEKTFDFHITGHIHVRVDYTLDEEWLNKGILNQNDQPRLVNLGSWYDEAKVFVLTDESAGFVALVK